MKLRNFVIIASTLALLGALQYKDFYDSLESPLVPIWFFGSIGWMFVAIIKGRVLEKSLALVLAASFIGIIATNSLFLLWVYDTALGVTVLHAVYDIARTLNQRQSQAHS